MSALTKCNNVDEYGLSKIPPGLLQYRVKVEDMANIELEDNMNFNDGFELERHTKENLLRLIPNTKTGRELVGKVKILVLVKRVIGDDICLKGALLNTVTNEIALITSIHERNYNGSRVIDSHDSDYKVCHCKMLAPMLFWDELKNRLVN